MKNDAIDAFVDGLNGYLKFQEKINVEKFHMNRIMFAWVNNKLIINSKINDTRDHQHWLLEDHEISITEFENVPRGYINRERIQLFIGSHFRPLEEEDVKYIPYVDFCTLVDKHIEVYPNMPFEFCNGVKVGKVGEIWPPIEVLATYDSEGNETIIEQ